MSFSTTYKHRVLIIRRKTMKKKKDEFYFKNLNTCVEISYQAAEFLKNVVVDFSVDTSRKTLIVCMSLSRRPMARNIR